MRPYRPVANMENPAMTNPQHEALVEAQDPLALLAHLRRMPMTEWVWHDAQMIFATLAALSATAATPSDEVVRLRAALEAIKNLTASRLHGTSAASSYAKAKRLARAALEPKGKDL